MEATMLTKKEIEIAYAICYEMRKIVSGLGHDVEEMVSKEIIPDFLNNFDSYLGYASNRSHNNAVHILQEESRRMTERRLLEFYQATVPWYKRVFYILQISRDIRTLRKFRRFVAGL